jgi:ABC-type spermidine/putrescine transport system permease subunit II
MRALRRRLGRLVLPAFVLLVFGFLLAPIVYVVLSSFNARNSLTLPTGGLSLRWYREILGDPAARESFANSAKVAVTSAVVVTIVGTAAALSLSSRRTPRRLKPLAGLLVAPAALPGIFIGSALVILFTQLKVTLSLTTVIIGHIVYVLPYFYVVASARISQFDPRLEEAAQDLGAGALMRLRRVVLPLVSPTLLAAAVIAGALSWDEFQITYFTTGQDTTLPMLIWSKARLTIDPSINALASLTMLASLLAIAATHRVIERSLR